VRQLWATATPDRISWCQTAFTLVPIETKGFHPTGGVAVAWSERRSGAGLEGTFPDAARSGDWPNALGRVRSYAPSVNKMSVAGMTPSCPPYLAERLPTCEISGDQDRRDHILQLDR